MAKVNKSTQPDGEDGLTARQRRFATEYVKDCNGKQAAIRAGYSEKGAAVAASRMRSDPKVGAYLDARIANVAREGLEISAERTLLELARLAYVDPSAFYDERGYLRNIHAMPEDARRALAGMESFEEFEGAGEDRMAVGDVRKVKWHDKRAALADLAKIQGLMRERVDLEGSIEIVIRDFGREGGDPA